MEQSRSTFIEEYERDLIQKLCDSIEKYGADKCLSSVILTGSLGRGEPSFMQDAEGKYRLISDVEIALIYPKTVKKETVDKLSYQLSAEFSEALNFMSITEKRVRKAYNFNFSFKVPSYKTIFTYDLFNGSKTIWGQDFIAEKSISLSEVDLYEAKRLVANRIGELIYLQEHTGDKDQKAYLNMQWRGKLLLAIASAWLICEGSYVSSYHGQYSRLKAMATEANKQIGEDFFVEYEKVFMFLRENGTPYEPSNEKLRYFVRNTDRIFAERKINKSGVNSLSRLIKYYIKYIKSGASYGLTGFEDKILQALISNYGKASPAVKKDAGVWHRVLY